MKSALYVELLGRLRVRVGDEAISRFRSQNIGALLAYLAYHRDRTHPREFLADMLWPDSDFEAARTNLRTALSSLRRQLEPPGTPTGTVLVSEGRARVGLRAEAVGTDVADFRAALDAARRAKDPDASAAWLEKAVDLYGGPLLPGLYENWVLAERDRLAEAHRTALRDLARHHEAHGRIDRALEFARRAVSGDPLHEGTHADVMRLLAARGETAAALRQFAEMERLLDEHLGLPPSPEIRALAERVERGDGIAATISSPSPIRRQEAAPPSEPPVPAAPEIENAAKAEPGAREERARVPLTFTRFFGREDEIAALAALLRSGETRLVTLTGPGGSGKTRLAIEAARGLAPHFPGRVWFVPLADLHESDRIADLVVEAIGLPRAPTSHSAEQAVDALSGPGALLVLDNFEHLVDGGAAFVRTLLDRTANLHVLVTSRQRLMLEGEREFPLPPLPVPNFPGTPERLLEFSSVQLFVNRAQAARPDFQISRRNAADVAALCARLEGIPLALELAAAWSQTLSPAQMLERVDQRLDLLVSRRRDVSPRHRTMRAAIEWSYRLLSEGQQRFFARLSVFSGGWTLPAAEAVCEEPSAMVLLADLREHSLIVTEEGADGAMRCRMLESLREFAAEQMTEAERDRVAERHLDHYLALAEEAERHLVSPRQLAWMHRLDAEADNLRAAMRRCRETGDTRRGRRLGAALALFWEVRSYLAEARDFLRSTLDGDAGLPDPTQAPRDAEARARAWEAAGRLAFCGGDLPASKSCHERALEQFGAIQNGAGVARCLNGLGIVAQWGGDGAAAQRIFEEGLRAAEDAGDDLSAGHLYANMGLLITFAGDPKQALPFFEKGIGRLRAFGESYYRGINVGMFGMNLLAQNDPRAGSAIREALLALASMESWWTVPYFLDVLASSSVLEGSHRRAARLMGAADTMREQMGGIPLDNGITRNHETAEAARRALGEEAYRAARDEGRAMSREGAVSCALEEISEYVHRSP